MLRPFLAADAATLAVLFQASIAVLCEDDYDDAQREAWMAQAREIRAFARRLEAGLTLIATQEGEPVGFISLKGTDHLDMLYVHPYRVREGIGSGLLEAIERLAGARKVAKLVVDASDTARPFFEVKGFTPRHRQTVTLGDQWLGNTRMEKPLRVAPPSGAP